MAKGKAKNKTKSAKAKPAKKPVKKLVKKPVKAKPAKSAKQAAAKKPAAKPSKHPVVVTPAPVPLPMPVVVTPPPAVVAPGPITAIPIVGIPIVAPAPAKAKPGKAPSITTQRKQLLDAKTIPELRLMLRKNDQITTGNKNKLVKRILDCVEYGGLPRCPQCGLGRLKVSKSYGFRCPGGYDDDEYVFCGFTAGLDELERPPWQFETPGGLV